MLAAESGPGLLDLDESWKQKLNKNRSISSVIVIYIILQTPEVRTEMRSSPTSKEYPPAAALPHKQQEHLLMIESRKVPNPTPRAKHNGRCFGTVANKFRIIVDLNGLHSITDVYLRSNIYFNIFHFVLVVAS